MVVPVRTVTLSIAHQTTRFGTAYVVGLAGGPVGNVTFEYVHIDEARAEPAVLDGFVLGFLLYAAEHADRLVVEGPVTAAAIRNASLLTETWNAWIPDRFRRFEIEPERTISDAECLDIAQRNGRPGRSIAAFSGGVDSLFTALRHGPASDLPGRFDVTDVVIAHGFDIGSHDQRSFDELVERTDPFLDSVGVRRHLVRTDVRRRVDGNELLHWEHAFGAYLASVLHLFSDEFGFGLIGSGEPVTKHVFPWGSTPMTDHLLSGGLMSIVHDGAAYGRTDKVERIARHDIATAVAKVCWEGTDAGRNCGRCEKCVRTRLNFRAVGVNDPACFDEAFDDSMIDTLVTRNQIQLNELTAIVDRCTHHGIAEPWVDRLRSRVAFLASVGAE